MNKNGSAVLIVTLVMGALSLFTLSVWRNTIFLHNIVLKKQEYERNFRATEAALNMGIALCKKYPKRFFIVDEDDDSSNSRKASKKKPFATTIAPWLSRQEQSAVIQIYPDKQAVLVKAMLLKGGSAIFGLRCTVELAGIESLSAKPSVIALAKAKKKQRLQIKNWEFETKRSKGAR